MKPVGWVIDETSPIWFSYSHVQVQPPNPKNILSGIAATNVEDE
jgi:hypothetical protein